MYNLYFLVVSFIYLSLVMIIYFYKKRVDSIENRLFSKLIVASFIGIILDFLSVFMAFSNYHNIFFTFINKLYLVYLLTWISIITIYTITISVDRKKSNLPIKIIKYLYFPMILFLLIL